MSLTSSFKFPISGLRHSLWLVPLAYLWFVLINDLRIEWTVNPQYSYGWAVPFLCLFILWQRLRKSAVIGQKAEDGISGLRSPVSGLQSPVSGFKFPLFSFCLLALLYAPTRLVEEANPGWRLTSWALALETIGLTLPLIHFALGASRLQVSGLKSQVSAFRFPLSGFRFQVSDFAFPLCFFLVAVPWPSLIEQPLIQHLTRLDTGITTELLGWLGIPAMPHGNVIEVATGVVGIDEACSGIRSFQATLMISLFLGEFYRLSAFRRTVLCLAGFTFSLLFNLARMSLLVWVAATKGINAIASWHDPAGVTILVACFFCLWGMGILLKTGNRRPDTNNSGLRSPDSGLRSPDSGLRFPDSGLQSPVSVFFIAALFAWIVLTEFSIEGWYRWHEARVPKAAQWTIAWPTNNPSFKESPIAGTARQILRYDEGRSAGWTDSDWMWNAVFLRWEPGRTAVHLAENHTPNVCMTAAGYKLDSISPLEWFDVAGLRLPFSVNKVENTVRPYFVFYCLWDDRASVQGFQTMGLSYGRRLAPVLAGLRNPGQRSLEIGVAGPATAAEAEAALRKELEMRIRVGK